MKWLFIRNGYIIIVVLIVYVKQCNGASVAITFAEVLLDMVCNKIYIAAV